MAADEPLMPAIDRDDTPMRETGSGSSYSAQVYCHNCGFRGAATIHKGVPVTKGTCPTCNVSGHLSR
jgi:DnaJ-class molecular chaperone